jgi:hypothetical protein
MATPGPNWAEQVTAIATAVGAIGLLGAIGAAVFASQQVGEARRSRQATLAAEFFRRWDDDALVETRLHVGRYKSKEDLAGAFQRYIAENSVEAFVLYRELDYFEQLAALEHEGAFDFSLIRLLLGRILIDRWEMWQPSIEAMPGGNSYPLFRALVDKMRAALGAGGE